MEELIKEYLSIFTAELRYSLIENKEKRRINQIQFSFPLPLSKYILEIHNLSQYTTPLSSDKNVRRTLIIDSSPFKLISNCNGQLFSREIRARADV